MRQVHLDFHTAGMIPDVGGYVRLSVPEVVGHQMVVAE